MSILTFTTSHLQLITNTGLLSLVMYTLTKYSVLNPTNQYDSQNVYNQKNGADIK